MSTDIIVALIASVPAAVFAAAAWRSARQVHNVVRGTNGHTVAETVEATQTELTALKATVLSELARHQVNDDFNFGLLRAHIEAIETGRQGQNEL